jgi:hypothetical protein
VSISCTMSVPGQHDPATRADLVLITCHYSIMQRLAPPSCCPGSHPHACGAADRYLLLDNRTDTFSLVNSSMGTDFTLPESYASSFPFNWIGPKELGAGKSGVRPCCHLHVHMLVWLEHASACPSDQKATQYDVAAVNLRGCLPAILCSSCN